MSASAAHLVPPTVLLEDPALAEAANNFKRCVLVILDLMSAQLGLATEDISTHKTLYEEEIRLIRNTLGGQLDLAST